MAIYRTLRRPLHAVAAGAATFTLLGMALAGPALADGPDRPHAGPPGQEEAPRDAPTARAQERQAPQAAARPAPTQSQPEQARGPKSSDGQAAPRAAQGPDGPQTPTDDIAGSEAPGNRGTVKIHRTGTPDDDRRNEPKVCTFRIVGFGFPDDAQLEMSIGGHGGPNAGDGTFSTSLGSVDDGAFAIDGPSLPDGMYKLAVDNTTAPGGSKQKVFKVDCAGTGSPEDEVVDDLDEGILDEEDVADETADDGVTGQEGDEDATGESDEVEPQVLGVRYERPAGAAVLAAQDSTGGGGGVLPRTGVEWATMVAAAAGLISGGYGLTRRARTTQG